MIKNRKIIKQCANSNHDLPLSHVGSCPRCGMTKTRSLVTANLRIRAKPSLNINYIQRYYYKSPIEKGGRSSQLYSILVASQYFDIYNLTFDKIYSFGWFF